jgi:hypothetical protein
MVDRDSLNGHINDVVQWQHEGEESFLSSRIEEVNARLDDLDTQLEAVSDRRSDRCNCSGLRDLLLARANGHLTEEQVSVSSSCITDPGSPTDSVFNSTSAA